MTPDVFKPFGKTEGVFSIDQDPIVINAQTIERLLVEAKKTGSGRSRLLLHPGLDDLLHEMVIVLPPASFDRPHINFKSGKSFVALHGLFAVVLFSDAGELLPPVFLSANGMENKMLRLNKPIWHTLVPINGPCVFLETILGPFVGNQFAPFSPARENPVEFLAFANKIRTKILDTAFELKLLNHEYTPHTKITAARR